MTKDGIDVTNSAGRGTKTKEQREHAHLMRIMKACDACKKKKIRVSALSNCTPFLSAMLILSAVRSFSSEISRDVTDSIHLYSTDFFLWSFSLYTFIVSRNHPSKQRALVQSFESYR